MTKQDFIAQHGDFNLHEAANRILLEACNTPEHQCEYDAMFYLTGKVYNHIWYNGDIDELETDWAALSKDMQLTAQLDATLEGSYFPSESEYPYHAFVLPNFEYNEATFMQDFFEKIGFSIDENSEFFADSPDIEEILAAVNVTPIAPEASLLMAHEPFENYYEAMDTLTEVDAIMHESLQHLHRISFYQSFVFNGVMPIFYVGMSRESSNLVGIFSLGVHT